VKSLKKGWGNFWRGFFHFVDAPMRLGQMCFIVLAIANAVALGIVFAGK